MKFLDLFAGCGGMSLGMEQAGMEGGGFVEWWPPAINTHKKNFPQSELIGEDIEEISDAKFKSLNGKIDVIVGGPPCQGFSMAGKRDISDPRNSLFVHFVRAVKIIQPTFFVMENVRGITSMKNQSGKFAFNVIMEEFKKINYKVKVKLLNSGNYSVPQARKRVIFIGWKDEKYDDLELFPKIMPQKVTVKDVLDLGYEQNEQIQHQYSQSILKNLIKFSYLGQGDNFSKFKSAGKKLKLNGLSPTITKGGKYIHPVYNRYCSVREVARLQSFPDTFHFCGTLEEMYAQIGNAVPVLMAKAIGKTLMKSV
jgi:DNA (cytosine-5)-methyltransferase 1